MANYKGFKESVVELCNDAGKFGEAVCGDLVKKAGASDGQVFRIERRRKTPGKIGRLIDRLETANELAFQGKLSNAELARQMDAAQSELEAIQRSLEPTEREAIGKFLVFENLPALSQPAVPRRKRSEPVTSIMSRREEDNLFPEEDQDFTTEMTTAHKRNLVYHRTIFVP